MTKREAAKKLRVLAGAMRYDSDELADRRAKELDEIADALDPTNQRHNEIREDEE